MGPAQAIRTGLAKSFQFSGRASRSEFWWFAFAVFGVASVLLLAVTATRSSLTTSMAGIYLWRTLHSIFLASPLLLLSAAARRHHDLGIPAVLPVLLVAPVLGLIYMRLAVFPLSMGVTPPLLKSLWAVADLMVYALLGLLALTAMIAVLPSHGATNRYGPLPPR